MNRKLGKEFEVILDPGKNGKKQVKLPIVAKDADEANELAEPVRIRRRLGPIVETKEKPKKQ
jgi:hypothetical protein